MRCMWLRSSRRIFSSSPSSLPLVAASALVGFLVTSTLYAAILTEVTELLAHPDQYDHQVVAVSGKVSNFQLATNREGRPAYGFLLQSSAGTVKVVGLGKAEVREGDYVIVEDRKTADNGEMVIALLGGHDVTLKKFYRESGRIRLQPANPTMQPIYVDPDGVQIQGVVVGVMRKY